MRRRILVLLAVIAPVLTVAWSNVPEAHAAWQRVWGDEFTGAKVDTNNWTFDLGAGGWGNQELEDYTSRPDNASVSNGVLHIMARQESYAGSSYTSARMKTKGLFGQVYGRFEFRAKFPSGKGFWPALWLMPVDSVYGTWPASGEIDVAEIKGDNPAAVLGSLHFGGPKANQEASYSVSYPFVAPDSATNFHVYALEWTNNVIRWFVDDHLYESQSSWWSPKAPYPAPFDQPFYIIMNMAVGGNFVGSPSPATAFPGDMQVDYVRVYQWVEAPALSIAPSSTNSLLVTWPGVTPSFLLQQTSDLSSPNWTEVTNSPAINPTNLQNSITLPMPPATRFFRLAN